MAKQKNYNNKQPTKIKDDEYGKWLPYFPHPFGTMLECSKCGRQIHVLIGQDVQKDFPYCHCGAKMRVGEIQYPTRKEKYEFNKWWEKDTKRFNNYRRINNMSKTIKIKYFDNEIEKIKKIDKGDWIDLRSAEEVELKAGEFKLIKLGVGMILPDGYEAHIVPRSSTYKNFGVIQTNHCGIVDESYSGDNDEWRFPAFALRDTAIHKGDRICQFRIVEKQPSIEFEIVEHLNDIDRGGFGSTGKI